MRFLLLLLFLAVAAPAVAGVVVVVPTDEPDLESALRVASRGDTVAVRAGFYEESALTLPRGVSLVSLDGEGRTIIQGDAKAITLTVLGGAGSLISGISFQGGTAGIVLQSSDLRVSQCRFLRTEQAVRVAPGAGLWVEDGDFRNNQVGIDAPDATTLHVAGSRFQNNGVGIRFAGTEARLYRNTLKENGVALDLAGEGELILGGEPALGNDIYQNKDLSVRNTGVTITGGHNFWGRIRCELITPSLEGAVPILPFTNFQHDSTFVECP